MNPAFIFLNFVPYLFREWGWGGNGGKIFKGTQAGMIRHYGVFVVADYESGLYFF